MKYDDAILITEDGTIITLNLPDNREYFAEYAAAVLRCTDLEPVDLTAGVTIWSDGEALGRWPYNNLADSLGDWYGISGSFFGPVLITGYGSSGVKPLPAETAHQILLELNKIPG